MRPLTVKMAGGGTMTTYKVVGQPATRTDGPEKVTGSAKYAADVQLPGVLWGKALRSPFPHARIRSIDTSKAEKLAGVHAVLTGKDVRGVMQGRTLKDLPPLAQDKVRFVGEKVAVVAADDEDIAEQALALIEVGYEELTPLTDPLEAMKDGAPLLHPNLLTYDGVLRPPERPSNVFFSNTLGSGDVEKGFAEADQIFEDTYTTTRVHQAYLEPRACTVWVDGDGRVQVWATNKTPYNLKQALVAALELAEDQVVINHNYIGGDFGAKGPIMDECLCYFLSLKTGKPVKMVMEYIEEFMAGNPRHGSIIRVKTGVKNDGTITAHQEHLIFNSGAYAAMMPWGFLAGVGGIAGNLRIPNAQFNVSHVYTNLIPCGYMRGPGEAQGTFAIESHVDDVARKMGMDPLEFRLKNTVRNEDPTPMGETFSNIRAVETLKAAIEASGYHSPKPANVGRGIAMCARPGSPGETHCAVTLRPDGSVLLETSLFEQGSGTYTMLAQVAAEELGLSADRVHVQVWNTDMVPFDSGVAGSRTTRMAVPAAYDAAQNARAELIKQTAAVMGWPHDKITYDGEVVANQDTGEKLEWPQLVARAPSAAVSGRAYSKQEGRPDVTSFCAQIAEIEVDSETGHVKLLRLTTAHDVGTVMSPVGHQGQINGAVVQGIGYGLMEDLIIEDGHVTTLSFSDYKVPSIADIPPMQTVLLNSNDGTGPYNVKAIGEAPTLGVAPAIANALADATGVRVNDLPLSAERVYKALRERK
jgi:CO/xanthine dehydrogenase Mo-binding subunit